MLVPTHVLLAAADTARTLATRGDLITASQLSATGFRLEGMRAGERLVVEVVTMNSRGAATINLAVQVGGKARQRRATDPDFGEAVKAAVASLV